jgi:hypothetical protein
MSDPKPKSWTTNDLRNGRVFPGVGGLLFRSLVREVRALSVNPLECVVQVVRHRKDLEVQTSNDQLCSVLGVSWCGHTKEK